MRTRALLFFAFIVGSVRPQGPASIPIRGHIHRLAKKQFDRGKASDLFALQHVTMMFKPSVKQQVDLNALLEQQQDPSSPNYHRWITPGEFADRFGMNAAAYNEMVSWLQDGGFTIDERAASRNWVIFTGSAGQIENAFSTAIHEYVVNGEAHYAPSREPTVPAAMSRFVLGFRRLHNFGPRPHLKKARFTSSLSGYHFITPDDFATIYNVHNAYDSGITGSGQNIVIAGQSDVQLQDFRIFRRLSGLPAGDPQVILVPGSKDPGIVDGDVDEATMDIEWSGAIAQNATVIYVNSTDVFDSLQYAIEQNLAPVMSVSYGACETEWPDADRNAIVAIAQQANAQGITLVAAAGDWGAADCDSSLPAKRGLAVDLPSSLPYVTGIGGTQFNESDSSWSSVGGFGNIFRKVPGPYWSNSNDGNNGSALSYIPEIAWNNTLLEGNLASTGGGRSALFPKPSWQVAPGVPNDSARDVPDVSFAASVDNDGYLACISGSCVNGYRAADNSLLSVGGTSIGAPVFASVVALINQMTGVRQGNLNPTLYRLANRLDHPFHDITHGGNQAPCRAGTPDCMQSGYFGYSAGPGYDLATGLGSIDVYRLLTLWGN